MRWKELLIGGAITLTVTVIGGLLVYFFTQEKSEPKIESLAYQLDKQVSFEGNDNLLSIGSLKFSNIGNEPAKTVVAEFNANIAEIIEFNIQSEGGAEILKTISKDKKSVVIKIKSLLPNEIVSATYLLNKPAQADFTMRSERVLGKEGSIYKINSEEKSFLNEFLGVFLPSLLLILIPVLLYLFKYLRSNLSIPDSPNNNGFVLLHKGGEQEALSILEQAVKNGIDGSHAMSNYAAALAMTGEVDKAKIYIEASLFLANSNHEKAIVFFNKSIVFNCCGDSNEMVSSLGEALKLSKSAIKSYFDNSKVMSDIASGNNDVVSLIENA
jgi:tetratricopeptide (TPR) repeat protein